MSKNVLKKMMMMLAIVGLSMSSVYAETYTIFLISGQGYLVTCTSGTVGDHLPSPQAAIDAIKTHAAGADCTIQFDNGTNTLNIGTTYISFNGGTSGTDWGLITLTGKLTAEYAFNASNLHGVIDLRGGVSINSTADITNTANSGQAIRNSTAGTVTISGGTVKGQGDSGYAISNTSTGEIIITGGTLSVEGGIAVYNGAAGGVKGTITITGGTVKATASAGRAVVNFTNGKITISGTAMITSANTNDASGTIVLENHGTETDCRLEITGGTVENTASGGNAIYNDSPGSVDIRGGEVTAPVGRAIRNFQDGTVNINGGMVQANGNMATIRNDNTGTVDISGGTVQATGDGQTIANYNTGKINISGGIVTSKSDAITNYNTGRVSISGTAQVSTTTTGSKSAIYNPNAGKININGGIVSGNAGYGIYNDTNGTITITDGTVQTTGNNSAIAFKSTSTGTVNINGGMILARKGYAINKNGSAAKLTLNDGIVFAYGTKDTDVINGDYTQNGNAVILAWNQDAGTTTYTAGTSNDIYKLPATATAVWAKESGNSGIRVTNNANTGFIPIEGITIKGIYTVTFAGEGVSIPPQDIEDGGKVTKPEDPEREDYDFGGWFTDNGTFDNEWDFDNDIVTQDITLWAKWTEKTGIVEPPFTASVQIYPNPTRGELTIEISDYPTSDMMIYDMIGRTVGAYGIRPKIGQSQIGQSEIVLDVSHLPSGVYLLRIGDKTAKFIKK
jgi:uncharacterized repeat protein (TIGR02543 family)